MLGDNEIDSDGNGLIELEEFIEAYQKKDPNVSKQHLRDLFEEADTDENGKLDFDEFVKGNYI
jgi:Ca2+-binding EF-hand superfamily protein